MYDFKDISIITHIRLDTEERKKNAILREKYYRSVCENLEFVYVEDDVKPKVNDIGLVMDIYEFHKNDDQFQKTLCYNIGASKTKRPYYCFLDLDCIIHPENILECVTYMNENKNTGMMYPYNGVAIYLKENVKKIFEDNTSYETLERVFPKQIYTNYQNEYLLIGNIQAPGGCFICDGVSFKEYNGFNPYFKGWGFEDNELPRRIHVLGYEPSRVSGAHQVLWHLPHESREQRGMDKSKHPYYFDNRDICKFVESSSKEILEEYIKTW